MKKEVKFSLVYRDMWQSSGKYVPRKDQLEKIAPLIIDMGCFDRVETNGGAAEQVNLLYGENPNPSVRAFTAALHKGGIECHMLDRALNALRMNPVPADVRQLMYKVKKAQGVDITRIFCGLNDVRNIIPSIQWANEAGMISQAAMSITYSQEDDIYDRRDALVLLLQEMLEKYPQQLAMFYHITLDPEDTAETVMEKIGAARGCVKAGGITDLNKVEQMVLYEFKTAKMGRFTLDEP